MTIRINPIGIFHTESKQIPRFDIKLHIKE